MFTFYFSFYCLNRWSCDKMYGYQSYSKSFGAPKTLDVLIERVVPLLNDGYQNKPFEGVWTPNGTLDPMFISHFRLNPLNPFAYPSFHFYILLLTFFRGANTRFADAFAVRKFAGDSLREHLGSPKLKFVGDSFIRFATRSSERFVVWRKFVARIYTNHLIRK